MLRVHSGRVGLLLTGDIEAAAEQRLLADPARLPSLVLKVPHHGSRTSSAPGFVSAVAPVVAVMSVGADNRYRLPTPEIERRYRARGTCVLRTDRCGAVTVETDGDRLAVDSMRGYNRRLSSPPESSLPMYTLARQLLFKLSPETSHDLSLDQDSAQVRNPAMTSLRSGVKKFR